MAIPIIEGLTALEGPVRRDRLQNTQFSLPPSFDTSKFAAKWEEKGNAVTEAQQPQYIESVSAMADGWQIYKEVKNPREIVLSATEVESLSPKEKLSYQSWKPEYGPVERATKKCLLILMFRPKALQKVLNIVYANQSRALVGGEVEGDTKSSDEGGDQGILTNRDLRRFYKNEGDEQDGYLPQTPLPTRVQEATQLVV